MKLAKKNQDRLFEKVFTANVVICDYVVVVVWPRIETIVTSGYSPQPEIKDMGNVIYAHLCISTIIFVFVITV